MRAAWLFVGGPADGTLRMLDHRATGTGHVVMYAPPEPVTAAWLDPGEAPRRVIPVQVVYRLTRFTFDTRCWQIAVAEDHAPTDADLMHRLLNLHPDTLRGIEDVDPDRPTIGGHPARVDLVLRAGLVVQPATRMHCAIVGVRPWTAREVAREQATRIVRHGLADVLAWLGQPVGPRPDDPYPADGRLDDPRYDPGVWHAPGRVGWAPW